jgi:anti-sigma B factor antagonist
MAFATGTLDIRTDASDGHARIRLIGELDILTAPLLAAAITRLRAAGQCILVFDLTELRFMDRSGLAVVSAADQDADPRAMLAVTGCHANVRRIFELTGHEHLLDRAELVAETAREIRNGESWIGADGTGVGSA